jgi:hypothetical protein
MGAGYSEEDEQAPSIWESAWNTVQAVSTSVAVSAANLVSTISGEKTTKGEFLRCMNEITVFFDDFLSRPDQIADELLVRTIDEHPELVALKQKLYAEAPSWASRKPYAEFGELFGYG